MRHRFNSVGLISKAKKADRYEILKATRAERLAVINNMTKAVDAEVISIHQPQEWTDELITELLTFSYKELKLLYKEGRI